MKTLVMGNDGEPSVWWHWQNLNGRGSGWKHGRAWLHWPGNSAGVEWSIGSKGMGAYVQCCDPVIGDEALTLHLQLPFLFSIWLMVQNVPILKRLPGVKWVYDDHNSGERMLSVSFHSGAMWWRLWRNPDIGHSHDWRDSNFNPLRLLLGRPRYSESERNQFDTYLEIPEGDAGWDVEDDAIYGLTCRAGTVAEAVEALRQSVLRDRQH